MGPLGKRVIVSLFLVRSTSLLSFCFRVTGSSRLGMLAFTLSTAFLVSRPVAAAASVKARSLIYVERFPLWRGLLGGFGQQSDLPLSHV